MKLFTHQKRKFVESLLTNRFIKNNGTIFSDEIYVRNAYDKLLRYINENITDVFTDYPIWCWYKIEDAIPCTGIRIELDIPEKYVILMDYYDWGGGVLYYSDLYSLSVSGDENHKYLEGKIEENLKICLNKDMFREDIQAIIPHIKMEWVTNEKDIIKSLNNEIKRGGLI